MDKLFAKFANATAKATGSPYAFLLCVTVCVVWAVTGPVFKYSETWQLVINTGTTIVTFLMVFLIQNTQNRDGSAIQTKLDELIRTSKADDEFMGIESLTDRELDALHSKCAKQAEATHALLKKASDEKAARQVARPTATAAAAPQRSSRQKASAPKTPSRKASPAKPRRAPKPTA